ncbi:uncharacterized protein LOC142357889 [Convolutriloba macropyga]|uniref:uncharacterized protein LOC142357889 n=1 Tax=Convolutriloba macropyga TaxID=536237 RepID=UPI003F524E25
MGSLDDGDGALTDIELDTVRSFDEAAGSSWCSWLFGSCSPCVSLCAPHVSKKRQHTSLPHHLSDPLLLGPPVAVVPEHAVHPSEMNRSSHGLAQSQSASRPQAQGGLELKTTAPNPLLGQWHRVGDRSFVPPRPY